MLRKSKGLSQHDIGKAMDGRTYEAVCNWESGSAYPSVPVLIDLANFLGVTLEELFRPWKGQRLI